MDSSNSVVARKRSSSFWSLISECLCGKKDFPGFADAHDGSTAHGSLALTIIPSTTRYWWRPTDRRCVKELTASIDEPTRIDAGWTALAPTAPAARFHADPCQRMRSVIQHYRRPPTLFLPILNRGVPTALQSSEIVLRSPVIPVSGC